jgi:hypothetical protein
LFLMNNALVQDESLRLARKLLQNKHRSEKARIELAYLSVFQREPTAAEVTRASKFIKAETRLLAAQKPEELVPRTSTPEPAPAPTPAVAATPPPMTASAPPASAPAAVAAATNATPSAAAPASATVAANTPPDNGGNPGGGGRGGRGGGFRFPRTFNGPGSASDVVVGKLAPGIAQPKVFHQALPEKPASPEEGALALFNQALFGSAEFRYLQ